MKESPFVGILFLILLGLFIIFCGCSSQETASTTIHTNPTTTPITQTTKLTAKPTSMETTSPVNLEITIHSVNMSWDSGTQYLKPSPGFHYVLVDFSVKNVGYPNGFNFNPVNVTLLEIIRASFSDALKPPGRSTGTSTYEYEYNPLATAMVPDGFVPTEMKVYTISYGETLRGKIVFSAGASQPGELTQFWLRVKGSEKGSGTPDTPFP